MAESYDPKIRDTNLELLASLCRNGARDKLGAPDAGTGLFRVDSGLLVRWFGKGRRAADSITALKTPLETFFSNVLNTVGLAPRVREAMRGVIRLRATYAGERNSQTKLNAHDEITKMMTALWNDCKTVSDKRRTNHQAAALSAMNYARNSRGYGSFNKKRMANHTVSDPENKFPSIPHETRRAEAQRRLLDFRENRRIEFKNRFNRKNPTKREFLNFTLQMARQAELAGIGNCNELADIALCYLVDQSQQKYIASTVYLDRPTSWAKAGTPSGDHVFLVIGPLTDYGPEDPSKDVIYDNFAQWPEETYICDPWANISCFARKYPDLFWLKMRKWNTSQKEVVVALTKTNDVKTINPGIDPYYCHSVRDCKKRISVIYQGED
jgi:hypothetical protein